MRCASFDSHDRCWRWRKPRHAADLSLHHRQTKSESRESHAEKFFVKEMRFFSKESFESF
jgi:hypothetical protein